MKYSIFYISAFILIFLSSCFKEDDKIYDYYIAHQEGELKIAKVVLGETYPNQVFFDLQSNTNISTNYRDAWDLAFECKADGWHIILNYGQMMYAGNSMDTNFTSVNSANGIDMLFDPSNGNLDSTAIGQWYYYEDDSIKSHKYTYIIDRGMDLDFSNQGKKKIQIDIKNGDYILKYADLNGENEHSITIRKNAVYQWMYFSFDDHALVNIAPTKDSWSLQFTKYATMLESGGEDYPYFVTGVLINPHQVRVALDSLSFDEINIQDTANYIFSKNQDFIGYDWKYYSFDSELYTIRPDQNFIIKNYDGQYYKLRFTDFYDQEGNKGTISFEYLRL